MAMLGNYIHRSFIGYNRYGITKSSAGSSNTSSITAAYQDIYNGAISKAGAPSSKINILQEELNKLYNNNANGNIDKIYQNVTNTILDDFDSLLSTIEIDEKGGAEVIKRELAQDKKDKINCFKNTFNQLEKVLSKNDVPIAELEKTLREFKQLLIDLNKFIQENSKIYKDIPQLDVNLDFETLKPKIKAYLATPDWRAVRGEIGERVVEYVSKSLFKAADDKVLNIAKNTVDRVINEVDGTVQVPSSETGQMQEIFYHMDGDSKSTQGKVDIKIQWDDRGSEIDNIQIKNLSGEKKYQRVHAGSGQRLLYYFQSYPDFLNHFINLFTNHQATFLPTKEENQISINGNTSFQQVKQEMLIYFRKAANILSLVGGSGGKDTSPNVFIIFSRDKDKTRIKLFSMAQLINLINGSAILFKGNQHAINLEVAINGRSLNKGNVLNSVFIYQDDFIGNNNYSIGTRLSSVLKQARDINFSAGFVLPN